MSIAERHLVRTLHGLGQLDVAQHTLPEMLARLVSLANEIVPGSTYAGITLVVDGNASTAALTDEVVPEIDQEQNKTGVGPCVDSARSGLVNLIASTPNDDRWKRFSAACVAHGVLSTLSIPVISRSEKRAALNFYSEEEGGFDGYDLEVANAFGAQASVAITNSESYWSVRQLADQLSVALESRVVIEQSKGCLMAGGLTSDEAFDRLRKISQHTNRKLRDVAADVIAETQRRSEASLE